MTVSLNSEKFCDLLNTVICHLSRNVLSFKRTLSIKGSLAIKCDSFPELTLTFDELFKSASSFSEHYVEKLAKIRHLFEEILQYEIRYHKSNNNAQEMHHTSKRLRADSVRKWKETVSRTPCHDGTIISGLTKEFESTGNKSPCSTSTNSAVHRPETTKGQQNDTQQTISGCIDKAQPSLQTNSGMVDKSVDKSFVCQLCRKWFTFATNLTRHQRHFHQRPALRLTSTALTPHGQLCGNVSQGSMIAKESDASAGTMQQDKVTNPLVEECPQKGTLVDCNSEEQIPNVESTSDGDSSEVESSSVGDQRLADVEVTKIKQTNNQQGNRKRSDYRTPVKRQTNSGNGSAGQMSTLSHSPTGLVNETVTNVIQHESINTSTSIISDQDVNQPSSVPRKYYPASENFDTHQFRCRFCDRAFRFYHNLGRHLKKTHSSSVLDVSTGTTNDCQRLDKRHVCSLCGNVFSFAANLSRHKRLLHSAGAETSIKTVASQKKKGETTGRCYSCDLCSVTFTFAGNLTRHLRQIHGLSRAKTNVISVQGGAT